jgi:hypothetical protein
MFKGCIRHDQKQSLHANTMWIQKACYIMYMCGVALTPWSRMKTTRLLLQNPAILQPVAIGVDPDQLIARDDRYVQDPCEYKVLQQKSELSGNLIKYL